MKANVKHDMRVYCADCIFRNEATGACHRYTPTRTDENRRAFWPIVGDRDFCAFGQNSEGPIPPPFEYPPFGNAYIEQNRKIDDVAEFAYQTIAKSERPISGPELVDKIRSAFCVSKTTARAYVRRFADRCPVGIKTAHGPYNAYIFTRIEETP